MADTLPSHEINNNTLTITVNVVKNEITKALDNGLIPSKNNKIKEMILKLDDNEKSMINVFIWKLEINEESKNKLLALTERMETLSKSGWYENLKNDLNENERMKELLEIVDVYLSSKFIEKGLTSPTFNENEIDAIKLVLFSKLQENLSWTSPIGMLMKWVTSKFQSLIQKIVPTSENKDWNDIKNSDSIMTLLESVSEEVSKNNSTDIISPIETLSALIDPSIEQLVQQKEQNWDNVDFSDNNIILSMIWGGNHWNDKLLLKSHTEVFAEIKKESFKLAETLKDWWDTLKKWFDLIEKLPFDLWSTVKDFLKDIVKDNPILWFIFWLFLGQDFLNWFIDGSENKKQSAIKNLADYSNEWNSLIEWKTEIIKQLKPESLKEFFKNMDNKKIDYTKENFWQELFTWVTNNKEIESIHKLLMTEQEEGTEMFTEEDFKSNWKIFLERLNGIKKIEKSQKIEKNNKEEQNIKQELALLTWATTVARVIPKDWENNGEKIIISNIEEDLSQISQKTNETPIKTNELSQEIINNSQEPIELSEEKKARIVELTERVQSLEFENSLDSIVNLPAILKYKWKDVNLDIVQGMYVKIWENKFEIALEAGDYWNVYKWIKFANDWINLTYKSWLFSTDDHPLETTQLKDVIVELIENETYSFNIPDDNDSSKIKAVLNIKKIV